MPFLTELKLRPSDGDKWRLLDHLVYETNDGDLVVVPPSFPTDLASIPRPLRLLYPVHGAHTRAAVIHDYLYHTKEIDDDPITRKEADQIFYEAMRWLGVRWSKAKTIYFAVRIGGWASW
ncbi:MAG: hypothetical protein COB36_10610 [Alphaproteobacteria bacterium]|nr:MAG: hypothetical protein COB36_10610 [Alphaproteobacteria bacterium]